MSVFDPFEPKFEEMERKVAATTHDRLAVQDFIDAVELMMLRRPMDEPMLVAQLCVEARVEELVTRRKAGWARIPREPDRFILVDPKGCVITDRDGKEITPPRGASLPRLVRNSAAFIRSSFASKVISFEGKIPHMYLDTEINVTIGIGHKIDDESEAIAIHRKFGFVKRDR